ncbi:hypothetical protein [Burkholderia ubonensis]|uniref:hypothetical protein n=1 Tax=Burkholderia ubonensis TaxID=101571 RepID=UPI000757E394|nr:hypothetical protein [Burkholderia ubonensis]KWB32232.1 hypothetical protein WL33_01505 [Burkholderia ubonensis]KWC53538.1 hypothetical protein WL53_22250 [Burkholderia ubonensis]
MNVHQIAITEDHIADEAGLDAVLAVNANVDCVIADGAYYCIAQTEAWSACGVLPVIPPPANAVVHDQLATRWYGQRAHGSNRRSRESNAASALGC